MRNISQRLNPGLLGIKPYEPGKTVYEAAQERPDKEFIKLASNENPFGMSPRALKSVQNRLAEAFAYPEVTGREARLKLAEKIDVDPDQIIFGNGADGLIYACALCLLAEGDEAVIPEITFSYYEIVVRLMRAQPVFSKMKNLEIDLDDVLARVTEKTKLIWLANPNNPTGTVIGRQAFDDFLGRLPEDVFVIHDEVYADFAEQADFPDVLSRLRRGVNNIFLIRSFSKLYGLAGIRVGYGVGASELVNLLYRVRPPFDVSVVAQIAAQAALEDEDFRALTLEHNAREKNFLYAALKKRALVFQPTSANFILIDTARPAREITEKLLARGLIVRPMDGHRLPTHIRLTIGTREQNESFLKALDEVREI